MYDAIDVILFSGVEKYVKWESALSLQSILVKQDMHLNNIFE